MLLPICGYCHCDCWLQYRQTDGHSPVRPNGPGKSGLASKWVQMGQIRDFFQIRFQYVLARRVKLCWSTIWKSPDFEPFGNNLTHLVPKCNIPGFSWHVSHDCKNINCVVDNSVLLDRAWPKQKVIWSFAIYPDRLPCSCIMWWHCNVFTFL